MRKQKGDSLEEILEKKKALFVQLAKFGLVGISNTIISYSVEMLGYYVWFADSAWRGEAKILVVTGLAFVISVTNSYYWNQRYVFKSNGNITPYHHLFTYGKTVASYGVTGLVLAPVLKLWLSGLGVVYWIASLVSLFITIPLNFVMNKLWAFRSNV